MAPDHADPFAATANSGVAVRAVEAAGAAERSVATDALDAADEADAINTVDTVDAVDAVEGVEAVDAVDVLEGAGAADPADPAGAADAPEADAPGAAMPGPAAVVDAAAPAVGEADASSAVSPLLRRCESVSRDSPPEVSDEPAATPPAGGPEAFELRLPARSDWKSETPADAPAAERLLSAALLACAGAGRLRRADRAAGEGALLFTTAKPRETQFVGLALFAPVVLATRLVPALLDNPADDLRALGCLPPALELGVALGSGAIDDLALVPHGLAEAGEKGLEVPHARALEPVARAPREIGRIVGLVCAELGELCFAVSDASLRRREPLGAASLLPAGDALDRLELFVLPHDDSRSEDRSRVTQPAAPFSVNKPRSAARLVGKSTRSRMSCAR